MWPLIPDLCMHSGSRGATGSRLSLSLPVSCPLSACSLARHSLGPIECIHLCIANGGSAEHVGGGGPMTTKRPAGLDTKVQTKLANVAVVVWSMEPPGKRRAQRRSVRPCGEEVSRFLSRHLDALDLQMHANVIPSRRALVLGSTCEISLRSLLL